MKLSDDELRVLSFFFSRDVDVAKNITRAETIEIDTTRAEQIATALIELQECREELHAVNDWFESHPDKR